MKRTTLTLTVLIMAIQTIHSQILKSGKTFPLIEDVSTINGLIKAFYEVVSGEAGEKRQWERDLSIHHPKAIYSYMTTINEESKQVTLSLEDFHKETDNMVLETAFYENEINREVKIFGNIANVWSTYETKLEKNELLQDEESIAFNFFITITNGKLFLWCLTEKPKTIESHKLLIQNKLNSRSPNKNTSEPPTRIFSFLKPIKNL